MEMAFFDTRQLTTYLLAEISMKYSGNYASIYNILRLVEAFKFTDEHGEVCPA
jgi:alkyl hydroperoxide reductase subunit AhpC